MHKARRTLHPHSYLLEPRHQHELLNLFTSDERIALEVTSSAYQNISDAYHTPNTDTNKPLMQSQTQHNNLDVRPSFLKKLIAPNGTITRQAGNS